MSIELKPCPFCGGAKITQEFDNEIRCANFNCEASMNWGHFCGNGAREKMAAGWNTRSLSAFTDDEIAAEYNRRVQIRAYENRKSETSFSEYDLGKT